MTHRFEKPEKGDGKSARELCGSYTALVFGAGGPYRNVHCALCNNANISNLVCLSAADLGR